VKLCKVQYKGAIRRDDKKNTCVPRGSYVSDEVWTRIGETAEENLARKDLEERSAARRLEPEPTRGPYQCAILDLTMPFPEARRAMDPHAASQWLI
jgi:hypothetical protein